jgi:hypothetical protein
MAVLFYWDCVTPKRAARRIEQRQRAYASGWRWLVGTDDAETLRKRTRWSGIVGVFTGSLVAAGGLVVLVSRGIV